MDEKSKEILQNILSKELYALSEYDISFLRARRTYLSKEQKKKYAKFLKDKPQPKPESQEGDGKAPEGDEANQPVADGETLQNEAKKPVSRMNRKELEAKAKELGIQDPSQYKTNKELADAIRAILD